MKARSEVSQTNSLIYDMVALTENYFKELNKLLKAYDVRYLDHRNTKEPYSILQFAYPTKLEWLEEDMKKLARTGHRIKEFKNYPTWRFLKPFCKMVEIELQEQVNGKWKTLGVISL